MAQPNTVKGTKLRILFGEGGPVVYTQLCALNAKGINFQTNTNQVFVPDCDNPDDPAWREITKSGRFASITGNGILDLTNGLAKFQSAFDNEDSIPLRVEIDIADTAGGGYWQGNFMLTQLNITGNDGELVQVAITLESDGAVTFTAS